MAYNPNDPDPYQGAAPYSPNNYSQAPPSTPYRYGWQNSQQGQSLANHLRQTWQNYTGQQADDDLIWNQYLNWDKAPDANFTQKLTNQMYNSDQAKAYRTSQASPPNTGTAPTAPSATPPPAATGSPVSANGQIPPAQPSQATYQPGSITQSKDYDPKNSAQLSALMSAILANPHSISPNAMAQMKEAQKEQALLMGQQNQSVLDQNAVGHGTLGSGANTALQGQNLQQVLDTILRGNRDIDIHGAEQNRQDELNALQAASGVLSQGYGDTLKGEQLREMVAQAGNSSNLDFMKFLEGQRQFNGSLGYQYNALDQNALMSAIQNILNGN